MRTLLLSVLLFVGPAKAEPPAGPSGTLPDVRSKVIRGECETLPVHTTAKAAAGADQTYIGEWSIAADGTVTGYEERLLFANSYWKSHTGEDGKAGEDCLNRWTITGRVTKPTGCADCDLAIAFEANIDYKASTCPQRLVVDGNHHRGSYDMRRNADGTLDVYFSASGHRFAKGYYSGQKLNYISAHRCVWL